MRSRRWAHWAIRVVSVPLKCVAYCMGVARERASIFFIWQIKALTTASIPLELLDHLHVPDNPILFSFSFTSIGSDIWVSHLTNSVILLNSPSLVLSICYFNNLKATMTFVLIVAHNVFNSRLRRKIRNIASFHSFSFIFIPNFLANLGLERESCLKLFNDEIWLRVWTKYSLQSVSLLLKNQQNVLFNSREI